MSEQGSISNALTLAIEAMKEAIDDQLRKIAEQKKLVNAMASQAGIDPIYADVDAPEAATGARVRIRSDAFANAGSQAGAAKEFLRLRGKERGSATLDEIEAGLKQGGWKVQPGLAISLGKDYAITKLANDTYGLTEWYPKRADERAERRKQGKAARRGGGDTPALGTKAAGASDVPPSDDDDDGGLPPDDDDVMEGGK